MTEPSRPPSAAVLLALVAAVLLVPAREAGAQGASPEPWPAGEPVPVSGLEGAHWFRTPHGWIVLDESRHAERAADEMRAAAEAYERHFGEPAPEGAVLDLAFAGARDRLESAGAAWALAYPFDRVERSADADQEDRGRDTARAASLRARIRSRLASAGIEKSEEEIDAMVEKAIARMDDAGRERPRHPDARKALRHEVAHMMFIAGQWPGGETGARQYGGGAPDWLDEAAAVLAEADGLTRARRSAFRELVAGGETIPLRRYFSMEHPVYGSDRLQAALDSARESGAVVLSGDEIDVGRAADFYAQTRGLVDFLLARSGEPTVFAGIARALKGGSGMEGWLREHGAEHGLPTSVAGLEDALLEWIASGRAGGEPRSPG